MDGNGGGEAGSGVVHDHGAGPLLHCVVEGDVERDGGVATHRRGDRACSRDRCGRSGGRVHFVVTGDERSGVVVGEGPGVFRAPEHVEPQVVERRGRKHDPPDPACAGFREPHVAVGSRCHAGRPVANRDRRHGELRDRSCRRHPTDTVALDLGEPQVPVRTRSDPGRPAPERRQRELRDRARRRHARDPVAAPLGEPQVPVRARGDRVGAPARGDREPAHHPRGGDLPDLVRVGRVPHVPVRTGGDAEPAGCRNRELRDRPRRGDPPDGGGCRLGEPQVPVRARGDPAGGAVGGWDRELRDRAGGRHPSDHVPGALREPHVAIRTFRDDLSERARGRDRELRDHPRGRDAADRRSVHRGVPQVRVGTGGDEARRMRNRELRDVADRRSCGRRDP